MRKKMLNVFLAGVLLVGSLLQAPVVLADENIAVQQMQEETYGYILSYVTGTTGTGGALHIASSTDGVTWTALNSNMGILYLELAQSGKSLTNDYFVAPYLFRKAGGTFGIVAAMNSGTDLIMYDSEDLINYTNPRKIITGLTKVADPEVIYENGSYSLNYTADGKKYTQTSDDLLTFDTAAESNYDSTKIAETTPEVANAVAGNKIALTKSEYTAVVNKFGDVYNTGIQDVSISLNEGGTLTMPNKVTAEYSNGMTYDLNVTWDTSSVNTKKAGTYKVSGTVNQISYLNNLKEAAGSTLPSDDPDSISYDATKFIAERADPYVVKGDDGTYYFVASVPKYDNLIIRSSDTLSGLQDYVSYNAADENVPEGVQKETVIWGNANGDKIDGGNPGHVWAPEMHNVNGTWCIFYCCDKANNWAIRPYVLICNQGERDPMNPECWSDPVKMTVAPGYGLTDPFTTFGLDMTVFDYEGDTYAIWAQKDYKKSASSLYIAKLNSDNPSQITTEPVLISTPQYAYERIGESGESIDEGPTVTFHDGRVIVLFSCADVDVNYCETMIYAEEGADLMVAASWTKNPYPLITKADLCEFDENGNVVSGEIAPGHASFTYDDNDELVFVYHARPYTHLLGTCDSVDTGYSPDGLSDGCRHARVKRVHWQEDGMPILKMTYEEELAPENQKVEATVTVKAVPDPVVKVKTITPDTKNKTLNVGAGYTIKYNVAPSNATNKAVSFSSSNNSVASVTAAGKVTAKAPGKTTITIKANDGSNVSATITVKVSLKAPAGVKAKKVNKTTIKISWKKSAGATGYIVYYATKPKGSYKKLKKVGTISYKFKKAKKGKTYYFKVKAIKGKESSPFSNSAKLKMK